MLNFINAPDVIISLIIIVLVILAIGYILRMKKKGARCIGCPNASQCGGKCHNNKS